MRRLLVSIVLALALSVGFVPAGGGLAAAGPSSIAQTDPTAPESAPPTVFYPQGDGIIPQPNSGVAPTDAGDRGGALQSALFFIVMAGVGVIGVLVVRSSRKARAARGF